MQQLYMNLLHALVLVMLCMIILFGVTLPLQILAVGTVPVSLGLAIIILILFFQSPILGIVGAIAGYGLIVRRQPGRQQVNIPLGIEETPEKFNGTLEESIVNNIVPLIQTKSPAHLNFKQSVDDTHSAALL